MKRVLTSRWAKPVVFSAALAPVVLLIWQFFHDGLGANPLQFITYATGDWTLRFLVFTLAVTPLRKLLNMPDLIRFRRMLGLFAFFYGCLHLMTYLWFDKFFDWSEILKDIAKRPYITIGTLGLALMVPLAITSNSRLDPPDGRQALADAAPVDLRQHRGRCDSLLLAGEAGCDQAGVLRNTGGDPAALPGGCLDRQIPLTASTCRRGRLSSPGLCARRNAQHPKARQGTQVQFRASRLRA
ncbi:MAG: protein-methionine-sulfoxide reductase heme-binding subunit MsrQ [Paludibaculum sp.]